MTSYTSLLSSKLISRLKISLRPAYMGKKHCKWINQHMIIILIIIAATIIIIPRGIKIPAWHPAGDKYGSWLGCDL